MAKRPRPKFNRWEIKQMWPAINLRTNENMERAESCEIPYYIQAERPTDEEQVILACREEDDLILKRYLGMRLREITVTDRIDSRNWKVTAAYQYDYDSDDDRPPEKVSIEFGTSTTRRKVCIDHVAHYGAMPGYGGLLDVQESGDGSLEPRGVEVFTPTGSMTITHYFKRKEWTTKLRNKIAFRRCRTNSGSFRGFAEGELLFTGESANYSDKDGYIEVQYRFLISENSDSISVGSMRGIRKKGWESLWVKYRKGTASSDGRQYQVVIPEGVSIDKVYHSADFTEMGLKRN